MISHLFCNGPFLYLLSFCITRNDFFKQNLVCGYQGNDRMHGIMVVTRIDEKPMKGVCQNEMFVSNII